MSQVWIRVIAGVLGAVGAIVIGVMLTGNLDVTADPDTGLIAGVNTIALVIAVGVLVGLVVYGGAEYLQTGALASITRQFDTRTIVLMPIAIAINIVLGQTVAAALKIPIYFDSIGTILVGALAGPIPGMLTGLLANLIWTFVLAGTPFASPYAWPFAIVAAEIGLLAGVFGYLGFFRSRPNTPNRELVIGTVVTVAVLGALAIWGILPAYTKGITFFGDLSNVDPLFVAIGYLIAVILVLAVAALVVQLFWRRNLGVAYVVVGGAVCGIVSAFLSAPISAYGFGGVTGAGTDFLVAAFQKAGSELADAVLQQGLISDPIDKTVTYIVVFVLLRTLSRRFLARFPQGERAIGTIEG
jgi:energy-coupling factor transport system substrate-specific component